MGDYLASYCLFITILPIIYHKLANLMINYHNYSIILGINKLIANKCGIFMLN